MDCQNFVNGPATHDYGWQHKGSFAREWLLVKAIEFDCSRCACRVGQSRFNTSLAFLAETLFRRGSKGTQ